MRLIHYNVRDGLSFAFKHVPIGGRQLHIMYRETFFGCDGDETSVGSGKRHWSTVQMTCALCKEPVDPTAKPIIGVPRV